MSLQPVRPSSPVPQERASRTGLRAAHALLALPVLAALSACGGGGGGNDSVATVQTVNIAFTAAQGSTPLATPCAATLTALGTGSSNARLQDLRFYVANVALVAADGSTAKVKLATNVNQLTRGSDTVALIDLRDTSATGACGAGNGHVAITGTVPTGSYVGLSFTLGVPETLNHVDPLDATNAPLDDTDMGWDWTAGKKHLKVEINPETSSGAGSYTNGIAVAASGTTPASTATSYSLHLGSTACSNPTPNNYTCGNVNSRDLRFAAFTAATQRVAVDLSALFAAVDVKADAGGAVGCMSAPDDPECQALWATLGASFGAGGANVLNTSSAFLTGQGVFKAIAR